MPKESSINAQVAEEILADVQGGESLKAACLRQGTTDKAMWFYRERNPDYNARLVAARREGMDSLIDRVLDVSRACIDVDNEGKPLRPLPQVSSKLLKLGIDAALRVAGKINPDKYGDKVQHQHAHSLDLASVLALADQRLRALDSKRASLVIDGKGVRVRDDEQDERALLGLGPMRH